MAGFFRQFSDDHKSTTASSKPSSEAGSAPWPSAASPGQAAPQPLYFASSMGMPAAQASPAAAATNFRFCAQCGSRTKEHDRFCASCGCGLDDQRRTLRGCAGVGLAQPLGPQAGCAGGPWPPQACQPYLTPAPMLSNNTFAPTGAAGPMPARAQHDFERAVPGVPHLLDHIRRLRCIESSEADVELARLMCRSYLQGSDGYLKAS